MLFLDSKNFLPDLSTKWEGQQLTSVDEVADEETASEGTSLSKGEIQEEQEEAWYRNPRKCLKLALPHVALLTVLLSYTSIGALVIQALEVGADIRQQTEKIRAIEQMYKKIDDEIWDIRRDRGMSYEEWSLQIRKRLAALSAIHEGQEMPKSADVLRTQWSFPSAVLYVITILTACGYDHVGPFSDSGKIFLIAYALMGIPIMFITAADIGKFLSAVVLHVSKGVINIYQHLRLRWKTVVRICCPSKSKELDELRQPNMNDGDIFRKLFDDSNDGEGQNGRQYRSLWFAVLTYFGVICAYCSLGGLLYCSYEGWEFITAFYFSFATITTVGVGRLEVVGWLFLILNVLYIVCGLAVVTMCVDLASAHLQAYFNRVHYFGRKLPKLEISKFQAMIDAFRKKNGGKFDMDDLIRDMANRENKGVTWPGYVPRNIRNWRFVDETPSSVELRRKRSSSGTHASFGSPRFSVV